MLRYKCLTADKQNQDECFIYFIQLLFSLTGLFCTVQGFCTF
jgi:hypothetical protein